MQEKSSLITGLWKRKLKDGTPFLIGRIGYNLNAVAIPNKKKSLSDGKNYPDFYLYFVNGTKNDIERLVEEAQSWSEDEGDPSKEKND